MAESNNPQENRRLRRELIALEAKARALMYSSIDAMTRLFAAPHDAAEGRVKEFEASMERLEAEAVERRRDLLALQERVRGLPLASTEVLEELVVFIKKEILIIIAVSVVFEETIIIIFKKRIRLQPPQS
ncbi:MAG TPA: hypothetical protein VGC93_12865 [Thermoanaerobaculia bacterium]